MICAALCESCLQRYEIRVALQEKALLDQLTIEKAGKCPKCQGELVIDTQERIRALTAGKELKEYVILTGTQFYQAVHGMPLPEELPQDAETVVALLLTNRIEEVKVEKLGERIYLHELLLSNGLTVHLCAGGRGAQVLKVTRRADG